MWEEPYDDDNLPEGNFPVGDDTRRRLRASGGRGMAQMFFYIFLSVVAIIICSIMAITNWIIGPWAAAGAGLGAFVLFLLWVRMN